MIHPYIYPGLKVTYFSREEIIEKYKILFIKQGFPKDFLENKSRKNDYIMPRHLFRYFLFIKERISSTYLEKMGYGNHATILHSANVIKTLIETKNKDFYRKFRNFDL